MSETRYICTRCGSVILEDRTLLTIQTGPVRQAGNIDVDLCKDCGERFADFLKTSTAFELARA